MKGRITAIAAGILLLSSGANAAELLKTEQLDTVTAAGYGGGEVRGYGFDQRDHAKWTFGKYKVGNEVYDAKCVKNDKIEYAKIDKVDYGQSNGNVSIALNVYGSQNNIAFVIGTNGSIVASDLTQTTTPPSDNSDKSKDNHKDKNDKSNYGGWKNYGYGSWKNYTKTSYDKWDRQNYAHRGWGGYTPHGGH